MGVMRFNFRSQALGRYTDVTVVFPTDQLSYYDMSAGVRHHVGPIPPKVLPCYAPDMKFQTVYLMHGGGDDDTLTYRYTNVERYAQENCVMLVTPNVANSFGVDSAYGVKYAEYLGEELPQVVQALFAASTRREDNFIVGYAMGGNVALGQAIRFPQRYAACVDISGGIGLTLATDTLEKELNSAHFADFSIYHAAFGKADGIRGSQNDLYAVSQANIRTQAPMPVFHLIAGSLEGVIRERVKQDARLLAELGYTATYQEVEGANHDFELWDRALRDTLSSILPLRRAPIYTGESR